MASACTLHWFRSDLRTRDNTALRAAALGSDRLACVFVFDPRLLEAAGAPRVHFLADCVARLARDLERRGSRLLVRHGDPVREIARLACEVRAERVTWNRDYSPFARERDAAVTRALHDAGIAVETCKDRVVFEPDEIRTRAGRPYSVYTPYRRSWWEHFRAAPPKILAGPRLPPLPARARRVESTPNLEIEVDDTRVPTGGSGAARRRLDRFLASAVVDYAWQRELPAVAGTSRLSPHLRFGTISVRECLDRALAAARADRRLVPGVAKWTDELVWREFYHAILADHPRVLRGAFRPALDRIEWEDDEAGLRAWCEGRTGYPFVDAGMRELLESGFMHNRVRMVVASFLCKDLLIDWRHGERFFMQHLVDGDPANNNGGWQWAASTGSDAQPYFRIFNPVSQGERFDPEGGYVRRWLPELRRLPGARVHRPWDHPAESRGYPARIVDHALARERALARYRAALSR